MRLKIRVYGIVLQQSVSGYKVDTKYSDENWPHMPSKKIIKQNTLSITSVGVFLFKNAAKQSSNPFWFMCS